MPGAEPLPIPKALPRRRLRVPSPVRWLLLGLAVSVALYLVSPYITLWRLNLTSVNGPTSALGSLVDIEAVRDQIQRRLNKDRDSAIGEVSDPFIDWIQDNIRSNREGALEQAVTLTWLRQLLQTHATHDHGFWPAISYAFYDSPTRFRVQIGHPAPDDAQEQRLTPVHLQLERTWLSWRVIAAYY